MLINLTSNIIDKKFDGHFGIQLYEDESMYIGNFSEKNKVLSPDDYGRIIHSGGEIYGGEIRNSRVSGFGIFNNSSSAEYLGEWKEESQKGYGIETWIEDGKFEGLIENGKKVIGTYSWKDGSYYEGEFKDNNFNGYVSILLYIYIIIIIKNQSSNY